MELPVCSHTGSSVCSNTEHCSRVELPVCSHTGSGVCPNTEHCSRVELPVYSHTGSGVCPNTEHCNRVELPVCSHTGSSVCPNTEHCCAINKLYDDIVKSLNKAERLSVPRIPLKSLKPFWSAKLNELKEKAILWHTI